MLFQNFELLWQILFCNALFGFIGQFFTNVYYAQKCAELDPNALRYLLLFNEFNWCMLEITIIFYSFIKASVIIKNPTNKSRLQTFMYFLFAIILATRINVGFVKFQDGKDFDSNILRAQFPSFATIGLADCIILGLLVRNYFEEFKNTKTSSLIGKTSLESSLPRITLIVLVNISCKFLHILQLNIFFPNLSSFFLS
jgi:hypothetical protein